MLTAAFSGGNRSREDAAPPVSSAPAKLQLSIHGLFVSVNTGFRASSRCAAAVVLDQVLPIPIPATK